MIKKFHGLISNRSSMMQRSMNFFLLFHRSALLPAIYEKTGLLAHRQSGCISPPNRLPCSTKPDRDRELFCLNSCSCARSPSSLPCSYLPRGTQMPLEMAFALGGAPAETLPRPRLNSKRCTSVARPPNGRLEPSTRLVTVCCDKLFSPLARF